MDDPSRPLLFVVQIDATYSGHFNPVFSADLRDATGKIAARTTCDLRREAMSRSCSSRFKTFTHASEHCSFETACGLVAHSAGVYTLHTNLAYGPHEPDLDVERVELAITR